MTRETLNTQFWKACKILRQDDNTNSLLDYVEQISWLLFLKCLEELDHQRKAEAEFEGKTYQPILARELRIPPKAITDSNLMAIRIPMHGDHHRSAATLGLYLSS